MRSIRCPACGSRELQHYTDACVVRRVVVDDGGAIRLQQGRTNEYDDNFFECDDCGYRPEEQELLGDPRRPVTSIVVSVETQTA